MKKLSVIVPIYNVERYLAECISSLLKQTYTSIEVILVDDGSTDHCGELCDSYAKEYSNIFAIHQRNAGLPSARNAGLMNATGVYVSFIDSDDYIDAEMFEKMIFKLENTNSDVAACNMQTFNKDNFNVPSHRYQDVVIEYSDENPVPYYKCSMDASCNKVFKMDIIRKHSIEFVNKDIIAQEDYYFQIKYFTHASRVVTMSDAFYKYRERASSISKAGQSKTFSDRCITFLKASEEYIHLNSDRRPEDFYLWQFLNMYMASINNVYALSNGAILDVLKKYRTLDRYSKAIGRQNCRKIYANRNPRSLYCRFLLFLLRMRAYVPFACLEGVRIRRLRSSVIRNKYFE